MRPDFSYQDMRDGFRRYKILVPLCVILSLVLAFIWLNNVMPQYTGEMILGPTSQSGVAARGIRLPFQQVNEEKFRASPNETSDEETLSDFARVMQLLTSPEIAAELLANRELHVRENLFPAKGVTHRAKKFLWRLAGQQVNESSDATALAALLTHKLHIDTVGRSAMRRVTLRHTDRAFAIALLNELYKATDRHLREQAASRTASETAYLRIALARVTQNDQRKSLTDLLAAQEQINLLLSVDLPFAADQIQQATAPASPDWPPVGVVLFLSLCAGLFIGLSSIYALSVRSWLKKYQSA